MKLKLNGNKLIIILGITAIICLAVFSVMLHNIKIKAPDGTPGVADNVDQENIDINDIDKNGLLLPDEPLTFDERDLSQFEGMKLIMLTFDDGPNGEVTEALVNGLNERNARASFFMVGSRIYQFADTVAYVYENGNTIGIHGFSHKNFSEMQVVEVMDEVDKTNRRIASITGQVPFYLRPPYGVSSEEIRNSLYMAFILWSVDSEDWKSRDADMVCEQIVSQAEDGAIILLHDLYSTSVEGALKAIDILSSQGYAFVSIDEYLQIKGISLKDHALYKSFISTTSPDVAKE